MSSSLGTLFRVSTFGESHGVGVGAIVDGCPAGLQLSEADIQGQLDRLPTDLKAFIEQSADEWRAGLKDTTTLALDTSPVSQAISWQGSTP